MRITEHIYMVGSGAFGLSNHQDCHVWLLAFSEAGQERLALVDAGSGDDTGAILENVRKEGLDPDRIDYVLLTHAHRGHAGGCAELKQKLPGCRIATSKPEAVLLERGTAVELGLNLFGSPDPDRNLLLPPCAVDIVLVDGEKICIGDLTIQAIVVPGHNPGCVCYLAEIDSRRVLFSGDTVYVGGYISVGNWPGSSTESYRENIRKLSGLNTDALLSGHHLFTLSGGQSHLDKAVAAFDGLWPAPQISQIL